MKNEKEKKAKTIEWLISCATDTNTHWEGIYELSPKSDFMSFYDDGKNRLISKRQLNKKQKLRLRKFLFSLDKLDYSYIGLADIVAKESDEELLNFLIKKLKGSATDKIWNIDFLMARIAKLSDRDDLKEIIKKIDDLDYYDKKEEAKRLVKKFVLLN